MITPSEIAELKKALKNDDVENLISKWESRIFQSEINKKGNTTLTLTNQQTGATKTIIGKEVTEDFVFHKDAWNGNFYVLSHKKTGIKILSGKKQTLAGVIKNFIKWEGLEQLTDALNNHDMQTLKYVSDETVKTYRKFYEDAAK